MNSVPVFFTKKPSFRGELQLNSRETDIINVEEHKKEDEALLEYILYKVDDIYLKKIKKHFNTYLKIAISNNNEKIAIILLDFINKKYGNDFFSQGNQLVYSYSFFFGLNRYSVKNIRNNKKNITTTTRRYKDYLPSLGQKRLFTRENNHTADCTRSAVAGRSPAKYLDNLDK